MYFVALAVRGCIPYRGPPGIEGELTRKLNLQNKKAINTDIEFSGENVPEGHSTDKCPLSEIEIIEEGLFLSGQSSSSFSALKVNKNSYPVLISLYFLIRFLLFF